MHNVMYSMHLVFIFEFIWTCHCDLAKYGESRVDENSPVKMGLSPTIMKVFIKGNLANDIEKILELYSREGKTQNEVEGGSNPMMDYLEKIYSFRNYDLLRPYRSIFRGFKTLRKHDHTTHSSWLKFLNRGKYATEDYWELNEPIVTKMPYHRLREKSRIERLNKEVRDGSTPVISTSSGFNGTNNSSPTPKKHSHLKSPLDVMGRKELSTPPSLRFCEHPCDVFEQADEATKLAPTPSSVSGPEKEGTTLSSGDGCDEDDEDFEVNNDSGSNGVLNIPSNKHIHPFVSKTTKHASPGHPTQITTHRTKPPKHHFTGSGNPNVWTLPPHPILDKGDNADVISTRLDSGSADVSPQTSTPPNVGSESLAPCACSTIACPCSSTSSFNQPEFCITRRRKTQKIIVRISSSLGEVPVVIMRDNKTNGVSLSLVNDFILDENNCLFKKVKNKNRLLSIKNKYNFNQSKFLPGIKIYPKYMKNREQVKTRPVLHPQPMQSPLFAPPPSRSFPFQFNPLTRVYGFPETRVGPQAYLQPFNLGLRPPVFPLYFGGNLQAPIPPPRQRFVMKDE